MKRRANKNKTNNVSREEKLQSSLPYLQNSEIPVFPKIKVKHDNTMRNISLIAIFVSIFIVFNSLFVVARVSGDSMQSTLDDGQFILASKKAKVNRFDIVILNEKVSDDSPNKAIVKRVIGFPDDVITVVNGHLYINNKKYTETYLDKENVKKFDKLNWTIRVPKGHVFVMGDNRDISSDSRMVGSFKKSAIVGVKVGEEKK